MPKWLAVAVVLLLNLVGVGVTVVAAQNTLPSSGNVGIGTTSPVSALTVASPSGWNGHGMIDVTMTGNSASFGPGISFDATSGGGRH